MANITDAQFDEQIKDLSEESKATARNVREQLKGLESTLKNELVAPDAVEKQLETLKETLADKAVVDKLEDQLKHLGTVVSKMKLQGSQVAETLNTQIGKQIEENKSEIKKAYQNKGVFEFEVKVVGDITTGSQSFPVAAPALAGTQMAPPANANLRMDSVLPLCTTFNTNQAAFPYTETEPKDGDFAFQTEGTAKAQIDFVTKTRFAEPYTLAAWEKLTEQAVEDIPFLQSVATDLLFKKHNLKKSKAILNGDGISPNPKGATVYAGAWVPGGSLSGTVSNVNIMDVINAVIVKIFTTANYTDEMPYMANIAMLNPIDFFTNFVAAKDLNGLPLYPTASLFNQVTIGGVTIIPSLDITAGKVFVGDMTRYNVSNYKSYIVKIGWVNDDFIKNQFVILGESRFHAFVRKLDEIAFIYDDIATIKTDIQAVVTP